MKREERAVSDADAAKMREIMAEFEAEMMEFEVAQKRARHRADDASNGNHNRRDGR